MELIIHGRDLEQLTKDMIKKYNEKKFLISFVEKKEYSFLEYHYRKGYAIINSLHTINREVENLISSTHTLNEKELLNKDIRKYILAFNLKENVFEKQKLNDSCIVRSHIFNELKVCEIIRLLNTKDNIKAMKKFIDYKKNEWSNE